MDCSGASFGQIGLDAAVDAVSVIYAKHDRHRSLWDIWSHAMHHAAAVAEEIRKRSLPEASDEKLKQEIADLTLWLFTMMARLKGPLGSPMQDNEVPQDLVVRIPINPSDLMWNRYPGVCPWCYCAKHPDGSARIADADFQQPCCCDSLGISGRTKLKEELRARAKRTRWLAKEHTSQRPQSIDDWQDMIGMIYRERLRNATLSEVALHLFEEMGETSDGLIRMYTYSSKDSTEDEFPLRQIRLEDELADVLSWLFGLVERLDLEIRNLPQVGRSISSPTFSTGRLLLSQILGARYGADKGRTLRCFHCEGAPCRCEVRLLQSEEDVEDLLAKLADPLKADTA